MGTVMLLSFKLYFLLLLQKKANLAFHVEGIQLQESTSCPEMM